MGGVLVSWGGVGGGRVRPGVEEGVRRLVEEEGLSRGEGEGRRSLEGGEEGGREVVEGVLRGGRSWLLWR